MNRNNYQQKDHFNFNTLARNPQLEALHSHCAIAQYHLTDSLKILEQEGIPNSRGFMLLPLIQQQMGGKN